jgi:hypothetical protein
METLMIPRKDIRQILIDLKTFFDLGLWVYFFNAIEQLEGILEDTHK